jgi:hypothetical protein
MVLESLLQSVVVKYGFESIRTLIRKFVPDAPEPIVEATKEAINAAAESFHDKHGDKYGGRKNSFLVQEANVQAIIRSTLPGQPPLSPEELSGTGFDGATQAPLKVRDDFVECLHHEMEKRRPLAQILETKRRKEITYRRYRELKTSLDAIRLATEEEKWFGASVDTGPRSNYLQYLRTIAERFEKSEATVELDVIANQRSSVFSEVVSRKLSVSKSEQNERRKLLTVLTDCGALIVSGPPGGGKSFLIEQLMWNVAIKAGAGPLAEDGFNKDQCPIPVYVTPGRGDIFDRIAHALHIHGLGNRPFSEEWIREALQQGVFLVAVDDANRFSPDDLHDMLDYKSSTQIILSCRDSSRFSVSGIQHYQVGPLTSEQAKAVLRRSLGKRAESFYYQTQEDERLQALAERPQTLLLLASAKTENSWIPKARFGLYDQAFRARHKSEDLSGDLSDKEWFKRRILGAIALKTLETSKVYSLSRPEVRRAVNHVIRLLNEDGYGIGSISIDKILKALTQKGHLFADGEALRFEHDRWLEFFAACELVETESALDRIESEEAQREVAFFASAISTMESEVRDRREFWATFWEHVSILDPFWALTCREQIRAHNRLKNKYPTLGDLTKIRSTLPEPTENEVRESFATYARVYQNLRDKHFPKMKEIFPPYSKGRVGVLVEYPKKRLGYSHGFIDIDSEDERAQLTDELEYITGRNKKAVPTFILSSSADPALGTPPAVPALSRLKDALWRAVQNQHLWEPDLLLQERAYFEAAALYFSNLGSKPSNVPASFDIAKLRGRLQSLSRVRSGKLELSNIHGSQRKVTYSKWIETLKRAARQDVLLENIEPPLPPPWSIMPICDGEALDRKEVARLKKWSIQYYELLYRSLFHLIKEGFPTTKHMLPSFANTFPVLIALVLGDRSKETLRRPKNNLSRAILGHVWIIQRRDSPSEPVEVAVLNSNSQARELAEEKGSTGVWRTGWSVSFRSNVPPLQNGVYREIRRDLKELLQ